MKHKCDLAGCIEPVEYVGVENKDEIFPKGKYGYYCKYDYPEAWDLRFFGDTPIVKRISDGKIMRYKPRMRKNRKGEWVDTVSQIGHRYDNGVVTAKGKETKA